MEIPQPLVVTLALEPIQTDISCAALAFHPNATEVPVAQDAELPIATELSVPAVAPASVASPDPMATQPVPLALAPLTPVAFDAPMAIEPWAEAFAAIVALTPPPMAMPWSPDVVVTEEKEPRAIP